ncbi:glutamate ABC transporter substrate-binding protein [Microbacteriaceae bacterium VKM Ac-2854]|nr:glutamate ABC transporter substrate-binding protein [Microbacteriaceae bacterium VKM Ac-2854]
MRKKLMFITAGFAAAALALTGCADTASTGGASGAATDAADAPAFEVATEVDLTGSPTYDKIKADGSVTIGVKEDQPGLGYLDPTTGERSGFDIEIAEWLAASLGVAEEDIDFKAIPSANREQALVNGDIDFYVGTYSITDARKAQVGFSGPYYVTGQQLLVQADNDTIKSVDDLNADTTVCSAAGSTPLQRIQTEYPEVPTVSNDTYSLCVSGLLDGTNDVVTTDGAILLGYASQQPDALKVVGDAFSTENYGVGVPLADAALRHYFNTVFTEGGDTWQDIYDGTLGLSGTEATQPEVDDYQ